MSMDTTVTGIGSVVVAELRSAGYMESTIGQYEKTIKALAGFADKRGSCYTAPLGAAFASMTVSPRTGRFSAQRRFDYGRLVSVFDGYLTAGRVDLSCRKRGGGGARPEMSEFTALAAAWGADMDDRGLAAATRDAYLPQRLHADAELAGDPLQRAALLARLGSNFDTIRTARSFSSGGCLRWDGDCSVDPMTPSSLPR